MKLALPLMLSGATRASASVLSPALQLASDLPDDRFKVALNFSAPLLPINATFLAILQFMSDVARDEFDEPVHPAIYDTPQYPQVQIATYTWTEARFLLWGIFYAAREMVYYARFNAVVAKLCWENKMVGQIDLMVDTSLRLPYTSSNGSQSVIAGDKQLSLVRIGNETSQALVEDLNTPHVQNATESDNVGQTASKSTSTSPTSLFPNAVLPPGLTIDFSRVAGAEKLNRNSVFLAFYAAILHIAKYPSDNAMRAFQSKAPNSNLRVMFETGTGCLVSLWTPPLPSLV